LIENFGELGLNFVTITKGNVTGAHHLTGRGGGIFNGNTPGISYPAFISYAQNSVITGNFARKGGGIYNDSGVINELSVTISNNTATDGGGIYNISTSPPGGTVTNGLILSIATKVQGNKARAGAGIFNRGLIELRVGSAITGNSTTATGTSEESCIGSASCDGLGGGVLSAHVAGGSETRFLLASSVISNNSASARGGAIYSVGVLELHGTTINTNTAADGGALYVVAPPAGVLQYCKVYADGGSGNATINGNTASAGYSIVSGGANGETDFRKCNFYGMRYPGEPTYLTASGNSGPNFCRSAALDSSSSPCPEPCGGLNQTCCSATSTGCNAGLTCRAPVPAGGSASCQP
jgi:predicted outer membrane repeat protein